MSSASNPTCSVPRGAQRRRPHRRRPPAPRRTPGSGPARPGTAAAAAPRRTPASATGASMPAAACDAPPSGAGVDHGDGEPALGAAPGDAQPDQPAAGDRATSAVHGRRSWPSRRRASRPRSRPPGSSASETAPTTATPYAPAAQQRRHPVDRDAADGDHRHRDRPRHRADPGRARAAPAVRPLWTSRTPARRPGSRRPRRRAAAAPHRLAGGAADEVGRPGHPPHRGHRTGRRRRGGCRGRRWPGRCRPGR